jgi:TatD DNase family protein
MQLFDTHFHLDLFPNCHELVQQLEHAQIYTIAVTTTPSVFEKSSELTKDSKYIQTALGLHPELAHERANELAIFRILSSKTRYIGEIGLDFAIKDEGIRSIQQKVFTEILDHCASSRDKILTIHSRRSIGRVLEILGMGYPGTPVLHWFSGTKKEVRGSLDAGCFFSINPSMVKSLKGQELIKELPLGRILLESDGPFLEINGRPSTPFDTELAIRGISQLLKADEEFISNQLFTNFVNILKNKS